VPTIIYLHGFNSSPQSQKAQIISHHFKTHYPDVICHIPALPPEPASAIAQVEQLISQNTMQHAKPVLMGSSLGGFYATYLSEQFDLKAVLINPAVAAHELLIDEVGEQTNFHTGEKYQFTQHYVEQLRELDVKQIQHPANFMVLLQTGDEMLDYKHTVALFSHSSLWVSGGGSHAFDNIEQTIPAILNFLKNTKE
jgi:hypothetical protein